VIRSGVQEFFKKLELMRQVVFAQASRFNIGLLQEVVWRSLLPAGLNFCYGFLGRINVFLAQS
jgi:hypothetical protein